MSGAPSRQELEAMYCWERDDQVARRPQMTAFRRSLRYHQALWRQAHGHPIGSQPIAPRLGGPSRPVGSRVPLEYARATGANFLTPSVVAAVRARLSTPEPHQTIDHQRIWADLLWSPAMAFNLFGDLGNELQLATRALQTWIPDLPGSVSAVHFAHSPGRMDPAYMNSLRTFDTAFVLDLGGTARGIVAVDVNYHERNKPETPRPENLWRYIQVAERSRIFEHGAIDDLKGKTDLAVMWLEHLLLHAMLQHTSGTWIWGHYVVIHPSANTDVADACSRYRAVLTDSSTFSTVTLERLLDTGGLPASTVAALRERYLPSALTAPAGA